MDKLGNLALQVRHLVPLKGLFQGFSSVSSTLMYLVFLYLVLFVCFYELLSRDVFSVYLVKNPRCTFAKIVNDSMSLTIFTKNFILDGWQRFEYASDEYKVNCLPMLAIS